MTLPTEPTLADPNGAPDTLVIYGAPKVGKTELVSVLPNHLLIDLERGSNQVTATKLQIDNIFSLRTIIKELNDKTPPPYKYVILDTLDALESWCEIEATRQYKDTIQGKNFSGDSVLKLAQGGGYLWLRQCFYQYFNQLRLAARCRVIFIGHLRDKFLTVEGKEVSSKDLDLTGKLRNIVCSYSDAIGRVYRSKEGKTVVSFKTTEEVTCGARAKHLSGKEVVFNYPPTAADWEQIYGKV